MTAARVPQNKRYLTLDELVALGLLPYTKGTIYQKTAKNELPHLKVGAYLMFDSDEIIEFLARSKREVN